MTAIVSIDPRTATATNVVADPETGIGATRVGDELKSTCFQPRLFAGVLEDGVYLEATIDHRATPPSARGPT